MSNTALTDLTATTTPASTDIAYIVDGGSSRQTTLGNFSKGIVVTNLDVTGLTASELIRTNSGGTAVESSGVTLSGSDSTAITGTAGTNGDLAQWNADGDLVDGPTPPSGAIVGTTDTQTLSNKTLSSPHIDTPDLDGDADLIDADGNITVAGADPWRSITLMPGFLKPTTTAGCAASTTVEAGTNDIDYDVLDFDASSDEFAFANFHMPDSWDAGVVQYRTVWTNAGGGSAETVDWMMAGRSYADDDAIDQAVGTFVTVTDTWIAQGDIHISGWSGNVTLNGTPAAGELVHIEIGRDTSEDDLTGDARLIALQIRYKQAEYSD